MGAAKRRGSRDERIAQALAKAEADRIAEERAQACRLRQRREELAAMPPEKRERVRVQERQTHPSHLMLAAVLGMALAPLTKDRPNV